MSATGILASVFLLPRQAGATVLISRAAPSHKGKQKPTGMRKIAVELGRLLGGVLRARTGLGDCQGPPTLQTHDCGAVAIS